MSKISKRSLRDLAATALGGPADVNDAGTVLDLSLYHLRLSLDSLVSAIELGGMDRADLQGHLISLRCRCAALEDFADQCLSVAFLPLDEDSSTEAAE